MLCFEKSCAKYKRTYAVLKACDIINYDDEFLHTFICIIGFGWKKCQSWQKILIKKSEIAAGHANYFREKIEMKKGNIFLS